MSDSAVVPEQEQTKKEKSDVKSWTSEEKELSKERYGCEIIFENGTWNQVSTKNCPNDAQIVTYIIDNKVRYDLTRSQKESNIFDMYWDKFKSGLKSIKYGNGRISPILWGNKPKKEKEKKRK